jgi:hypothetical protein
MSTQDELHKFYGERYDTRDASMDQYELSGYNLPETFNPGDRIIHINCGNNPFKEMIPNFHAQDPTNENAEYVMTLEEYSVAYRASKFHNALILNGLDNVQPGQMDHYVQLISQLMVKRDARIFWRTAINNTYPWTFDEHTRLAALINYSVVGMVMETETDIYAEWGSNVKSTDYSYG